jgi:hypothetical protein
MRIIITESQYNKLKDIPLALRRRLSSIDLILKDVVKMYDVDEYNKFDFVDEVLHSVYDKLDYDDVNQFFDSIEPMYKEKIEKIYDYKVKRRNKRK